MLTKGHRKQLIIPIERLTPSENHISLGSLCNFPVLWLIYLKTVATSEVENVTSNVYELNGIK